MGKFSSLVPLTPPWDSSITELPHRRITIKALEAIDSQYGPAFIATCDTADEQGEPIHDIKLLIGGTVLRDQINKLLVALEEKGERLPIDVEVTKVKGKNNNYWCFIDPDDPTED